MTLINAIKMRRSIRKYKKAPISERHVRDIVDSGMDAPSAGNLQSRHFYVVRDLELRNGLASAAFNQRFISDAPVAIVVCADLQIKREYGSRGVSLYTVMDCAASIQNMLLTAYADGYGTCWVGAFDEAQVSDLLCIPRQFRPIAIIPVGIPNESPLPPSKVTFEQACEFL